MMERPSRSRPRGRPRVSDKARKRNNVTIRMRDELKSKVEQSAAAQQRSISEEIETRLVQSFADQERFGGPEMLALVNLMSGHFLRGGQLGARACQHPEWTPAEWMSDPFCYRAAVHSIIDALVAAEPKLSWQEGMQPAQREEAERLHNMFARWTARELGNVKVHRGEKKR